ncbi:hypothetical protein AO070_14145 [Pseudomonas syringae pv. syringae PD2766]|nr:hypothetical protein AO070_14145 [Pseudomonas syringae pv. syringae PD2766]
MGRLSQQRGSGLIEFIFAMAFGAMLWVQGHENKCEVNKETLGKLFYVIKYGNFLLCVALLFYITKVRFFSY